MYFSGGNRKYRTKPTTMKGMADMTPSCTATTTGDPANLTSGGISRCST